MSTKNILLCERLNKLIVLAHDVLILFNFFAKTKFPRDISEIATWQTLYDETFEARDIYHTRVIDTDNELNDKACTFSAIYASDLLQLYVHFITQSHEFNIALHYHMSSLEK